MGDQDKKNRNQKMELIRHSASHVMAEAVQSLFPQAKFGIGPVIENGFYYDFDLPRSLTPEDLPVIEARMTEIISQDLSFTHEEVAKEEARRIFAHQPYKLELIDEIPEEQLSIYRQGTFVDLCRGPHVSSFHEEAGPGLVHWHPKGATVRRLIEDFWIVEHLKRGYEIVYSPHIAKLDLWKMSGHWELYREHLYSPMDVEGQEYLIKPMNCPAHILMYKTRLRSYRDLPIRWAELGTVYRYERSGVLHGLTRVRGFTQDDAHIFCRPDQLEDEVVMVLEFAIFMMHTFGFQEYEVLLATRPEQYAGTIDIWEKATNTLEQALKHLALPYRVDPGEGVFYGPKIDIRLQDTLGRTWQGPTTQVDFNLPQRFDVTYVDSDGMAHPVVMVHRTVLGSMERFFGCLIEHYGGAFPIWLAPIQAVVIPISDRHLDYAHRVAAELQAEELRTQVDVRPERMNLKIRQAQLQKIPYMLIVGDKEMASGGVSVRLRSGEDLGRQTLDAFKEIAKTEIAQKTS